MTENPSPETSPRRDREAEGRYLRAEAHSFCVICGASLEDGTVLCGPCISEPSDE